MSTHIAAKPGEIAEAILLPGDPLRAQWIAENFFENAERYNTIRNMFGFTGTYKGKRISVQGTGMGMPSISIYAHELFNDYNVQTAIRVGTCGGLGKTKLRDVVIAMAACTDSNINRKFFNLDFAATANYELLENAVKAARAHNMSHHVGAVATMDLFYDTSNAAQLLQDHGVLALEMETNALYTLAARFGRRALTIATVSDLVMTHEQTPAEEREQGFRNMIEVALEAALA
jgi:purine-nucleoside phosphorylase